MVILAACSIRIWESAALFQDAASTAVPAEEACAAQERPIAERYLLSPNAFPKVLGWFVIGMGYRLAIILGFRGIHVAFLMRRALPA